MSTRKRVPALFLCLLLLLLTACSEGGGSGEAAGEDGAPAVYPSYYDRGLEVVALLDEMIHSDSYFQLMTSSGDVAEVAARLAEGSYTTPAEVYRITLPETLLSSLLEQYAQLDTTYSPALRSFLARRMFSTVATTLNAQEGATSLAAASIFTASLTFVSDTPESGYAVYLYDDAQPVLVTFVAGEDGAVTATGNILVSEQLKGLTRERLEEILGDALGQLGQTLDEILIEPMTAPATAE